MNSSKNQKNNQNINYFIALIFLMLLHLNSVAQNRGNVYVDNEGVMRWGKTKEEVKGFGVNYSVPFAHAYRSAERMGIDPKRAIDNDVYHFSRLGFDLYRLHVWDTEISDTLGNLIENEHLDAFDYLLKKLKENNINYVITPIAFWGNGWPEPDTDSPGFSSKYGKGNSLDNVGAIKAAENYLEQFLNHINPYTGVAYKNEPNIIAFEISNEPHHSGEADKVTAYVKKMVDAMRTTGTEKPIFYNTSHGVHFAQAYFDGGIQGGTFQWYPTGLGYGKEIPGNLLPNVNDYNIPFDDEFKANEGAKLVYEFDAANVGRSYIYPAIARSFREAGIQIGTHFAYDPTYLAPYNTEYNTHYMNLNFTPSKALALMIAGKVFHESPMYTDYGTYPENNTFDNVTISYEEDLAVYNSENTFIYTNSTNKTPKNLKKLIKIAGVGNSPLVKYSGTGAYFLDKLDENTWRLEMQPDAVWVSNPFGTNSPKKTVGVVQWNEHTMQLTWEGIKNLSLKAINNGNKFVPKINKNSFSIVPGTYLLSNTGNYGDHSADDTFENGKLSDYYAPEGNVEKPWLKHKPVEEASAEEPLVISAQFIAPKAPLSLQLVAANGFDREVVEMERIQGTFDYVATIPANKMNAGYLNYNLIAQLADETYRTYPANREGRPFEWDFYDRDSYEIRVVPKENPIYLFNADEDVDLLVRQWRRGFSLKPTEHANEAEYLMDIGPLFVPDNENLNAEPIYDYTFKHYILDDIEGRKSDLDAKKSIVFKGRALRDRNTPLQIALVLDDGSAYGGIVTLTPKTETYALELSSLKPVKTVTLPRPYPSFLPYYFEHNNPENFDINRIESIQFSVGPGLNEKELKEEYGLSIISLWLE
ncbi:cellulase family glycosylhydrolase [Leeuwenhoekiella nanhaiensis]|uniref:Glycoside hydrolase family 5 domain-containing protein n=1 Tax=Leeuwenhoekiella nanhaiensis TaxID=1655491 RepID=A0A2G1VW26_9FLAO|nr:cellulase family glycosylhydrolase [Leeuwenhoekiella nanhaiensis]PHQ30986.1 hypothetical protein CJ305_01815 [Leeuwenhoekiella nanhaiensis]